jgi:hypothetical protein
MAGGFIKGRKDPQKKNSRVSPCFFHQNFFKTALMGDIKLLPSRHCHRHRHRYRRHRRSRSTVEKKKEE